MSLAGILIVADHQLREAKGEITKLQNRIEKLTHVKLEENGITVMKSIAAESDIIWPEAIADNTGWSIHLVRYHLDQLVAAGYVHIGTGERLFLTSKGRAYMVDNKLI